VILLLAGAHWRFLGWQWWRRDSPPTACLSGYARRLRPSDQPELGSPASDRLSDPFGIAADRNGVIYVTDGASGTLVRLEGEAVRTIATGLTMPSAIAVASEATVGRRQHGLTHIVRIDSSNWKFGSDRRGIRCARGR
jgi:hypothetical protein